MYFDRFSTKVRSKKFGQIGAVLGLSAFKIMYHSSVNHDFLRHIFHKNKLLKMDFMQNLAFPALQ